MDPGSPPSIAILHVQCRFEPDFRDGQGMSDYGIPPNILGDSSIVLFQDTQVQK